MLWQILYFSLTSFKLYGYKIFSCVRRCLNISSPMWIKNNLHNFFSTVNRSRKLVLVVVVLLVVLLYLWPSWLSTHDRDHHTSPLDVCIDAQMNKYLPQIKSKNAFLRHFPSRPEDDEQFVPFAGNGYIGLSNTGPLYARERNVLSMPLKFSPRIVIEMPSTYRKEAVLTSITDGSIYSLTCFQTAQSCVVAMVTTYAHRSRPSLLIQDLFVYNPTNNRIMLKLTRPGAEGWTGVSVQKKTTTVNGESLQYEMYSGTLQQPDNKHLALCIVTDKLPESITVNPGSSWRYHLVTSVNYSQPAHFAQAQMERKSHSQSASASYITALSLSAAAILEENKAVWNKLWHSGFGISLSLAQDAVNGDRINATLYYIMSHTPAPVHDISRSLKDRFDLEKSLFFPDRCYDDNPTLQHSNLWKDLSTVSGVSFVVKTWLLTLSKWGCDKMLGAGADGALQAALLSLGGLKFHDSHLEFNTHPRDLHRDYFWRRLNYGNNTHVNISVIVKEDNKAQLSAALDRNDRPYYACDAGCLDPPVKLSKSWSTFPVKLTDPLKAILYITSDKAHMEELKHAIHVREINEAPAHEHHVMALHRHGHHYGGLPTLFWVSIAFLVAIFHLFLFKLIINEYWSGGTGGTYSRGKYNL